MSRSPNRTDLLHLLAVLEYDGSDFFGFQRQKRERTVQEELESALAEFAGEAIRVTGGGRTDTGVHASGQTASFNIKWNRDLGTLERALNAKLPRDLAVKSLREVPSQFSARKNALSRTYRYTVLNQPVRSPLQARYALWVSTPLNVEEMRIAGSFLVGKRDLGAFGTPPNGDNTTREIRRLDVRREGSKVLIEIEANAFLYKMARRIVGTLLSVGRGEIGQTEFEEIAARKRPARDSAPANGLELTGIRYDL